MVLGEEGIIYAKKKKKSHVELKIKQKCFLLSFLCVVSVAF